MEGILKIMNDLEKSVSQDLSSLLDQSIPQAERDEVCDSIKINISAAHSEIKIMIENKVRLRQLALLKSNSFLKDNRQRYMVYINAIVKRPRTITAQGVALVTWNKGHCLNTVVKNPLSVITKQSCEEIGLLACLTQISELGIKSVLLCCTSPSIASLYEQLELLQLQNFSHNGVDLPNKHVLSQIYRLKTSTKVDIVTCRLPGDNGEGMGLQAIAMEITRAFEFNT